MNTPFDPPSVLFGAALVSWLNFVVLWSAHRLGGWWKRTKNNAMLVREMEVFLEPEAELDGTNIPE